MKNAKIYVAGALFDGISGAESLKRFQQVIRDYLTRNGLSASAPAVYLAPARFDRARLFLENGFDIIPADSEPHQIALSALFDSIQTSPPDEFIFAFGPVIPDRFLDKLAERGKRTLLTNKPLPVGTPYDTVADISSCLCAKAAVQPEPAVPVSPAAPVPDPKPAVIVPLPPREPDLPKHRKSPATPKPAASKPAASKPEPSKPEIPAAPSAPVTPAAPSVPKTPAVPPAPAVQTPSPVPQKPVLPPVPAAQPAPADPPASSAQPAPAPAEPAKPAASALPRTDTASLIQSKGTEGIQIGIDSGTGFDEILKSLEAQHGKVSFSKLAASVRTQVHGMENASDAVIRSLIPDDYRNLDDIGHLTVQRNDRPELDPIPTEVGVWLLQHNKLLNSELTEMVSSHSDGVTLSDLTDELKTKHPILEAVVDDKWIQSRLPNGLTSFNAPNGPVTIMVEAPTPAKPVTLYPDFETISKRSALMKDYCRWLTRKDKKNSKTDQEQKEIEYRKQGARLFVNLDAFTTETERDALLIFADCYESLEISARLLHACLNSELVSSADMNQLGQACANAVCMLKTALIQHNLPLKIDGIQLDAFGELRKFTDQYRVFLKNMKMEDRIDPVNRKGIRDQYLDLEKRLVRQDTGKRKQSIDKRIKYHFDKIKSGLPGSTHDWNVIVGSITELVKECGVAYTSDEIKGYLRNYIGKIPEDVDLTDTFIKIVQHIEVASDPEAARKSTHQAVKDLKISNGVRKVRKAYKGSKLVFIGGTPQPHIEKRLKLYFQVESVIWEETCHGDSLDRFQGILNDDQVRLILVYIPWCSHKHSLEFSKQAKEAGKDFVRIRKGTNPETIAAAVCEQIGLKRKFRTLKQPNP